MRIHYNRNLEERSRNLRNNSTLSEVLLWNRLKSRLLCGYQFSRQKPIGQFIVDFYCSKLNLVVEIDGESHVGKETYDVERRQYLESLGLSVLQFSDRDVKTNLAGVYDVLNDYVDRWEKTNTTP